MTTTSNLQDGKALRADTPLAVVCGGGSLPFAVADAAIGSGRRVVLFGLRGSADPHELARYPHHWLTVTEIGKLCRLAHHEGCRELVFIGSVLRPTIGQLRLNWRTLRLLPRIVSMFRGGDGHLLAGVTRIFEEEGFRVVGAHEIAPQILVPAGPLGFHRPDARDQTDISRGLALLRAIGPFDVGQAVVVADSRVLAVEAAEGTDHMLAHLAALRRAGQVRAADRRGVLVKAPKPGQDRRIDLPSIGVKTVEAAAKAGLSGIAVVAGSAIMAEPDRIIEQADREKLFVVGVHDEADRP
jgi:DUF1009 family protein